MAKITGLYGGTRRIIFNQWRIFRTEGPGANLRSLRQFSQNHTISGMFRNGLRVRISQGAIRAAYRKTRAPIVIAIFGGYRGDVEPWLRSLRRSIRVVVLYTPADSEPTRRRSDPRLRASAAVGGVADLTLLRRETLHRFGASDVILIEAGGALPTSADIKALHYGARAYDSSAGAIGIVTPLLRVAASGKLLNGYEWDRVSSSWVTDAVRGVDHGQALISRYVLGAPAHGLYIRNEILRLTVEGESVAESDGLAGQVRALIRTAWAKGWRTLAFPHVSLDADDAPAPKVTDLERQWLSVRNVRAGDGRVKIIYVLLTTAISGGTRTVFEQSEQLIGLGHDVEIWSLGGPPEWTRSRTPVVTFATHDELTLALAAEDAIKVATWWETAQLVWLASTMAGVPVYYVQEFETWFYPDDAVARAAVVSSYRLEMDHITIASYQADELRAIGIKSTIISSAYDPEKFHQLPEVQRDDSTVMAVGRSFFQKNFAMTLRAWRSLDPDRPKLSLFGFEPEIVKEPDAEYLNRPTDREINDLYNTATVFVQTSIHEGFCLPILEAMAAGCPVITTDSHGNRDFCVDGKNCIIVGQDDSGALAAAIRTILADVNLQARLREGGLETAASHTWKAVTRKMEAHYLSLR